MELSAKDRILLAIYLEYQKDLPNMESAITQQNLKLGQEEFNYGVSKLKNENLINGGKFPEAKGRILMAFMDNVMPSNWGIKYVEEKLLQDHQNADEDNDPKTGNIRKVMRNAIAYGWNEIKDIAAKTLAEMSKQ
jgi:hypothetical protein